MRVAPSTLGPSVLELVALETGRAVHGTKRNSSSPGDFRNPGCPKQGSRRGNNDQKARGGIYNLISATWSEWNHGQKQGREMTLSR